MYDRGSFVDPKEIFDSVNQLMENIAAQPDRWGNITKEYNLTPEELSTANIYLDHFIQQPADALALHWEIPSTEETGIQLIPHDMEVEVRHSIGRLTTFFTFLKSPEGSITAHKSFHMEEDENIVANPDFPKSKDFIIQQSADIAFNEIEKHIQGKVDIKSIKTDEMMAVRALISSLYKA